MRKGILPLLIAVVCGSPLAAVAQNTYITPAQQLVRTGEDSLQQGYDEARTVISGYGDAAFQRNFNQGRSTATLERAVLFVGHQFNNKFSFFSELELENGKVVGGESTGEIAMEQAYIRYNLNSQQYFVTGLFIPRIGIINENHLPVNFNGVERPIVEQVIIPATWRELGIGWYGTFNHLQLSAAVMNGLNSEGFEHGTGLEGGRAEGFFATANNAAVTAAAVYSIGHVRVQVSGYMGGTVGLNHRQADSLRLDGGAFGTPLMLGEADVQYSQSGVSFKALGVITHYSDAGKVDRAYGKNLATGMYGAYAELGYDVLHAHSKHHNSPMQLIAFARYEMLDQNRNIPDDAIIDETLKQRHLIAGLNFMPIPNLTFKADVRLLHTGDQNPALVINPAPNALPYQSNNTFLNVGFGYSF